MVRPRGIRKKPVVLSSEDEEDKAPTSAPTRSTRNRTSRSLRSQTLHSQAHSSRNDLPNHQQDRQTSTPEPPNLQIPSTKSTPKSSTKSASTSPQKNRKNQITQPVSREKAIYSFFNKQTQKQNQDHHTPPVPIAVATPSIIEDDVEEDFIQDDSLDEEDISLSSFVPGSITALAVRKRSRDASTASTQADKDLSTTTGQKFLKTERGRVSASRATPPVENENENDRRPWMERFGPRSLDELAVHKKKVGDVQTWLSDVLEGRVRKRLLLLKGPAGSAKTTTLRLLSEKLKFDLQEWKNPTSSMQTTDGFISMTAQFEDFMSRTGKYHGLDLADSTGKQFQERDVSNPNSSKQVILIEEFPASISNASSALQAFRSAINQFLAASTPSMDTFFGEHGSTAHDVTPLVVIISETLLSSTSTLADSFTAHRLLGQEILNHPSVTTIEFNPIAPTIMSKALELIVLKESRVSGRRKTPGPQVIKRVAEVGDVRSAISSLEFLCLRGDEQDGWGSKVAFTKPKKGSREAPLTKMEEESLSMVTQRENTLGIFHSVGKVVYNKRLESDVAEPATQPPTHLPQHRRSKVPEVNPNTLLDELGTDIQTFVSALHENYAPSCNGPSDEESLDSLDGCMEALSDADILSPDRFSLSAFARRTFQGTATDNLRQEETSFQVAVRGLLFNLPNPVRRQISHGAGSRGGNSGGRGESHQMYWPTSLRLWRKREEVEGLLDLWIEKAQNGALTASSGASNFRSKQTAGGVETWRQAGTTFSELQPVSQTSSQPYGPILLAGGSSARHEMLLERLPYMAKTYRKRGSLALTRLAHEFEKVTTFQGIEGPTNEEPEEDETVDPTLNRQVRSLMTTKKNNAKSNLENVGETEVAALVLSDDDIEDY